MMYLKSMAIPIQAWIAFQFDIKSNSWVPCKKIAKVYHSVGHIRNALAQMRNYDDWGHFYNNKWVTVYQMENRLELVLNQEVYNPISGINERLEIPNARLLFIETMSLIRVQLATPTKKQLERDVLRLTNQAQ